MRGEKMKTAEGHLLKDDLSNYDDSKYKKPSLTVDVIILTIQSGKLKVLLIKRKHPPFRDHWAIPGGFVEIASEESLEAAANREIKEETNLENLYIEQLKTYGDPKRDPRTRVVTVAYIALMPYHLLESQKLEAGSDAKEAEWFDLADCIEDEKLAFDHKQILQDACERVRGKIWYSDLAFNFVPAKFTWAQLQNVYEIILGGKRLTASNFRRKISSLYNVVELKSSCKCQAGRPATHLTLLKEN